MWTCKNCNAENEDSFDICWSCGSDKFGSKSVDKIQEEVFKKNKAEAAKFANERQNDFQNNKVFIIITASVLLAAFFMPWIKFIVSVNAWDLVFGDVGDWINNRLRYLAVLIPVSSIMIIYGTGYNQGKYPFPKAFLFSLPLLTLIVIGLVIYSNSNSSVLNKVNNTDFGEAFKIFGIGFWLTLISSAILCYLGLLTNFNSSSGESEQTSKSQNATIPPIDMLQPERRETLTTNQSAVVEHLEKLQKMKQEGLISDEDYQKMKNKIIASFD